MPKKVSDIGRGLINTKLLIVAGGWLNCSNLLVIISYILLYYCLFIKNMAGLTL